MPSRGVSTSNCYVYFLNILYLKKSRSYQIFTLAFIYLRECLYLCILFLLLQPKAAPNKRAPLSAMLTKGAVRDNLPPVARALALHEFKMAPMLKREVTRLVIVFASTPTAYAFIDTTIIHHVYKPDFAICVPFSTTGSWVLFAVKLVAVFGLVFFQVNDHDPIVS